MCRPAMHRRLGAALVDRAVALSRGRRGLVAIRFRLAKRAVAGYLMLATNIDAALRWCYADRICATLVLTHHLSMRSDDDDLYAIDSHRAQSVH